MQMNHQTHIAVLRSWWVFLLMGPTMWLSAQPKGPVTFTAAADARQVVIGSYFDISFTLKNDDGEHFKPPSFSGFTLLSGPNRSISTSSINGRWSRELVYSFTLQPKKIGRYEIPGATIKVRGKTMTTNKVNIEVVKGKSGATSQDDLQTKISEQVFIRAVPNTDEAYIGQQILLDYKIYTTLDIETYNLISESEYPGFYAEDIRRVSSGVVREVINGIEFSTKILKRVALFPQQAGALTIDPLNMRLAIVSDDNRKRRRSFFQTRSLTPVNVQSDPVTINIKRLPPGAPQTFTGAVGKYFMGIIASRNNITTDEAIALTMTISGDGDVKQVQPPPINIPKVEVYDPRVINEKSEEINSQIASEKVIEYLLLPIEPGRYNIAPEFTYFDTDSLKYITLKSSDNFFDVKKGIDRKYTPEPETTNDLANARIRDIQTATILRKKKKPFIASPIYWSLMALPLFLFGGVLLYRQKQIRQDRIDPSIRRRQQAAKIAQKHLATSKQFLEQNDPRSFYDEISRASLGYIGDKLSLPTADLRKHNIAEKLRQLGVSEHRIDPFIELLVVCEGALYGGMANIASMKQTYQTAAGIIEGIEGELNT